MQTPAEERPAPRPRARRRRPRRAASRASPPASPPGCARTRKKRTKGSARPSFSPDSRFRVWRTIAGTRCAVTTVEVTTGSVGVSTAASRNASAHVRFGKIAVPDQGQEPERDRHRQHDRPRHRAPVDAQQLPLHEQPVREQGQDQRQLDQVDDRRVAVALDRHHAGLGEARCRARPRAPRSRAPSRASGPRAPRRRRAARRAISRIASPNPISCQAYIRFSGRGGGRYQST